jgi:hypothetical protein
MLAAIIAPAVSSFCSTNHAPTARMADCRNSRKARMKDENDPVQSLARMDWSTARVCRAIQRSAWRHACPAP